MWALSYWQAPALLMQGQGLMCSATPSLRTGLQEGDPFKCSFLGS